MGDFTQVKSPMKIHGTFYLSWKTPDYKMTHQLFTPFWIISNILTFHFYTFSVIYTFYFYIAFEELTFYQKWSIKCVLYSLFYQKVVENSHCCFIVSISVGWSFWARETRACGCCEFKIQRKHGFCPFQQTTLGNTIIIVIIIVVVVIIAIVILKHGFWFW